MADDSSPIFMARTGEITTDATGEKPTYLHFQLEWASVAGPKDAAGQPTFRKVLRYIARFPGSNDASPFDLRTYGEDGTTVIERDEQRDKGEVRAIADKFEKLGHAVENGTPIGVLNLDPAKVDTLKAKGIKTVEALREVPEVLLPDLGPGARAMRDRAAAFLTNKDRNAEVSALQTKLEGLTEEMKAKDDLLAEMKAEMADLTGRVDGLGTGQRRQKAS